MNYKLTKAKESLARHTIAYEKNPSHSNKQAVEQAEDFIEIIQRQINNPNIINDDDDGNGGVILSLVGLSVAGLIFGIIIILIIAFAYYIAFKTSFSIFIKNKKDKYSYEKLSLIKQHNTMVKENPGYLFLNIVFTGVFTYIGGHMIWKKITENKI
jgi:hypothetical protein